MSVVQYGAAFLDQLNVHQIVPGMRLFGHEFLVRAGHRRIPIACSSILRRWIHFEDRGAAWLQTYDQETDMLLVCMEKEADCEFALTCLLLHLRRSFLDDHNLQVLILHNTDLYC